MEKRETPHGSGRVKTPRPYRFFEPEPTTAPASLAKRCVQRQLGRETVIVRRSIWGWVEPFPCQSKNPDTKLCAGFLSLEQLNEFVRGETGLAEDLLERGIWQILAVERHDGRQALRFVPQDEMAASLSFFHEPGLFERRHQVGGSNRREPGQAGIGRRT